MFGESHVIRNKQPVVGPWCEPAVPRHRCDVSPNHSYPLARDLRPAQRDEFARPNSFRSHGSPRKRHCLSSALSNGCCTRLRKVPRGRVMSLDILVQRPGWVPCAILLPGGTQAGLGLPLWFLLYRIKTDTSSGSVNSPIRTKFLEKRIQV